MADEDQRERGPRAQQEAQRRRRRDDNVLEANLKLAIPPKIQAWLDAEGRTARWVNDENNRMHRFTVQDDYDKVEGVEPVPVGQSKDGRPVLAHLLSKPAEFVAEDRAAAEKRRSETEEALFRSPDAPEQVGQGSNPNPATAARFVDKSTKIERRRNNLEG